jgi:lipoprotein-releasing system ATP-binding protein
MSEVLRLENITRHYREARACWKCSAANLSVSAGEIVALVGPSGSGKSSLLRIAGLLEAPTGGDLHQKAPQPAACRTMNAPVSAATGWRFVYQAHHLLPEFDALENVVLPQMIAGHSKAEAAREEPRACWKRWAWDRRPIGRDSFRAANSGGSPSPAPWPTSRACCWRTSPTGNLDPKTSGGVDALIAITRAQGLAALIATLFRAGGADGPGPDAASGPAD